MSGACVHGNVAAYLMWMSCLSEEGAVEVANSLYVDDGFELGYFYVNK